MFWGLTPSLDLLKELEEANYDIQDEINILLIGGCDARHILKTMAQKYRHKKVKINFYVIENTMETVAKQLLLLNLALQPPEELGLVQKTRFFMELYGNTILRPAVAKYLDRSAQQFVRMITNPDYLKEIMVFVDLDIRYKDRDYLENLFKFWCSPERFNIFEYWDKRLRKSLGVRYDTKSGVFDWDLHMRFHNVGGNQVCPQEYQHFRKTGIAFSWLESEVSKPNRSMVCGVIRNGERYAHYGYLGDMVTGPYVAYGLSCEDKAYLKSQNGKCDHRATDVTERNLMQMFYEIEHQEKYIHTPTNDLNLGNVVANLAAVKVVDIGASGEQTSQKNTKCIGVENVKFNVMPVQSWSMMKHKKQFQQFFDLIYFNCAYLKAFDGETVGAIAKNNALIIVENEIFVLSNREKQMEEYEKQLDEKMQDVNCKSAKEFNVLKDFYAKYIFSTS